MQAPDKANIKLHGIYHANGGVLGELAYIVGKILGTTHCALCHISHTGIREKQAFRECKTQLPAPLETLHLNEQSAALSEFTKGKTPCVVLERDGQFEIALNAEALEACHGDMTRFKDKLYAFINAQI